MACKVDVKARSQSQPTQQRPWFGATARRHWLREAGAFQGGSSIGGGECVRKGGAAPEITGHIRGYIRVRAVDFDAARSLVAGNPVFEAGGTVEIRELPKDDRR